MSVLCCERYEVHKPPFIWGWLLQIRAERGTIFTRRFQQRPRFRWLGAPAESGDRASGVSAKVKPFNRFQADRKYVGTSGDVIEDDLTTSADNRK